MKPWTTDPLDRMRPHGRGAPGAHAPRDASEPRWPSTLALHAWDAASLALFRRLVARGGIGVAVGAAARSAAPA